MLTNIRVRIMDAIISKISDRNGIILGRGIRFSHALRDTEINAG